LTTADNALAAAVERCAQEPIQIPGSIQPHGFLLVLDECDLRVLQASENVERWLGVPARELIGCNFADVVSESFDLRTQLERLPEDEAFPFHIGDVRLRQGAPFADTLRLLTHRHDQVLIAEFEPLRPSVDLADQGDYYPLVRGFVSSLHNADSLEELLQQCVVQVKRSSNRVSVGSRPTASTLRAMARCWPNSPTLVTRATLACASQPRTSRARPATCTGSTASV